MRGTTWRGLWPRRSARWRPGPCPRACGPEPGRVLVLPALRHRPGEPRAPVLRDEPALRALLPRRGGARLALWPAEHDRLHPPAVQPAPRARPVHAVVAARRRDAAGALGPLTDGRPHPAGVH